MFVLVLRAAVCTQNGAKNFSTFNFMRCSLHSFLRAQKLQFCHGMNLKILRPFQVFAEQPGVTHIVAESIGQYDKSGRALGDYFARWNWD